MTFWEHLEELRKRLIISVIFISIGVIVSFIFGKEIEILLRLPLELSLREMMAFLIDRVFGGLVKSSFFDFCSIYLRATTKTIDAELFKVGPAEGIIAYLKVSLTAGLLLASPFLSYQIWAFTFPALTRDEKKLAVPLLTVVILFFAIGVVFAHLIVAPLMLGFSAKLFTNMSNLWDIQKYVEFLTRLLIGFGIAFELPIVISFLSWTGVITVDRFRQRRKVAILLIFILSAFLTPADLLSMLLMAIPLVGLYELGIIFAFIVERRITTDV